MGKALTVRVARPSDLAEIDALLSRAYPVLLKPHYPPSVLVTAIPHISKAQPKLLASGTYFAVLDVTDRIVGAGGWTATQPGIGARSARATGHIRHVVTDPTVVRQGIGRALMDRVIDDASAAGMRRLNCFSTLMAVPFYVSCGFKEIGATTINLRPGIDFPAVLMRRTL